MPCCGVVGFVVANVLFLSLLGAVLRCCCVDTLFKLNAVLIFYKIHLCRHTILEEKGGIKLANSHYFLLYVPLFLSFFKSADCI